LEGGKKKDSEIHKEGDKYMKIPITKPFFDEEEKLAVNETIESGWIVQGPKVEEFERLFAEFVGAKFAIATSSCTTALHLGLEAMGIGRGDKVIVPSFTYVASANAVEYTGAEVVFCDINLRTFNIDETKIEELISKDSSIKAIMPVNLFGLCANLPYITKLAKKYNLKVIEDSACGFDAWIGNKHSGTFGDCGCFSFHPRKSITTGEGGMLVTDNEYITEKVYQLRNHGASLSDFLRHKLNSGILLPDFPLRGYNYRMTDLQAAIGICQMRKKEYIMKKRREVAKKYDEALKEIPQLIAPYTPENYKHGYQSYVCIFTDGEDISNLTKGKIDRISAKRNILMRKLAERGIATRQGTHAVHTLSYYKNKYNLKDEDFLMSYAADRLSIALPLYVGMTDEEFDYIITSIKEALS
jgi:dTDP-4-amino-4,6-dideoxygalactose transaminase